MVASAAAPLLRTNAEWAVWYAGVLGWHVFPVFEALPGGVCSCGGRTGCSPGKHPRVAHGLKDASADAEVVKRWWVQWPNASIGLRTGLYPDGTSGPVVLDSDSDDGDEWIRSIAWPPTVVARTGGGGWHYLVKRPPFRVTNKRGVLPGLDIRGDDGYIVLPPSTHVTGGLYQWEASPIEVAVCAAPDQALELLRGTVREAEVEVLEPTDDQPAPDEVVLRARRYLAAMPGAVSGQGGHDATFNAACVLTRGFGLSREQALAIMLQDYNPRCLPPWAWRDIKHKVFDAWANSTRSPGYLLGENVVDIASRQPVLVPDPEPEDARIVVEGGRLAIMTDEAETALLDAGTMYQRGGVLVRTVRSSATSVRGLHRHEGSLVIVMVEMAYLVGTLTRLIRFVKRDGRSGALRPVNCPPAVAETLLARRGEWAFPVLTGIAESPVMRPDGTILNTPGYDHQTGLFFDPGSTAFAPVEDTPSREDAVRASTVLTEVLREFPWKDARADLAAAVAAILTTFARQALSAAPIFVVSAPCPRTGKSLLCEVVGMIATGRQPAAMTQVDDEDEQRKRLLSVLMSGDPVLVFDNVEHEFGGPSICAVLSQPVFKDRVLGASRDIEVSTAVTFLANGNNLVLKGDITARAVPIYLDSGMERPEEREHEVDLYEEVPSRRGEIAAAALTMLRAYHLAGRPDMGLKQWGGGNLAEWSSLVRGAVVWCGMEDPTSGRQTIEQVDPVSVELNSLLSAWRGVFGNSIAAVCEAIDMSNYSYAGQDERQSSIDALREAIVEIADDRGKVNRRRLGRFIARYAGRVGVGGFYFWRDPQSGAHAVRWAVLTKGESPTVVNRKKPL